MRRKPEFHERSKVPYVVRDDNTAGAGPRSVRQADGSAAGAPRRGTACSLARPPACLPWGQPSPAKQFATGPVSANSPSCFDKNLRLTPSV